MSLNAAFHPLRISEVRRETPDAVSIAFDVPADLRDAYKFDAGQYLTLKQDIDGQDVRRNYSVCVSPLDGELRIAVKQIAGGTFSTFANTKLKAGDTLEVMAPMGRFTVPAGATSGRRYVGFAGGSGITPVLSILKTVLKTDPNSRFTLFYGNRNTAQIIFLEELASLKNQFLERLELYHFLEDEAEDIELFNGRLDAAKCAEVIDALTDVEHTDAFFICGPGPMMDAAEKALLDRGVPHERILIERFTTDAPSAARTAEIEKLQQQAQGLKMTVIVDGRRAAVTFDAEKGAILDNVRAAGLPAPFACKGGVCATCRAKVIEGTVEMKVNYVLTEEEIAAGHILTCQSVPTSDTLSITYDV